MLKAAPLKVNITIIFSSTKIHKEQFVKHKRINDSYEIYLDGGVPGTQP